MEVICLISYPKNAYEKSAAADFFMLLNFRDFYSSSYTSFTPSVSMFI